jgi:inorganic pyrophosphatase
MTTIWAAVEARIARDGVVIDRPIGSVHPRFPAHVYPLDYGYIPGTTSADGAGVDVFVGSLGVGHITGLLATFDEGKGDAEIKVLCGCTPDEIDLAATWLGGMVAVVTLRR